MIDARIILEIPLFRIFYLHWLKKLKSTGMSDQEAIDVMKSGNVTDEEVDKMWEELFNDEKKRLENDNGKTIEQIKPLTKH